MEASFFLNIDALKRIEPDLQPDEASLLRVFDAHRDQIHAAAIKVFGRGQKGSYDISAADI